MYLKNNLSISMTKNGVAYSVLFQSERRSPSILDCKQVWGDNGERALSDDMI